MITLGDMEDYFEHMFYIPLLHVVCRNWKEKKEKILQHIEENKSTFDYSGEVFTDYFRSSTASNGFFQELFDEELNVFLNKIQYETKKVHSSWIEISKNRNNHPIHNHQARGYSAICYVKFDRDFHEPTVFVSPFLDFYRGNVLDYKPNVDEGSIIFFPSAIMHYTVPNQSNDDRIIASFNIREND